MKIRHVKITIIVFAIGLLIVTGYRNWGIKETDSGAWAAAEKIDASVSKTDAKPDTGTIIGKVRFEGDAPFRRAVNFGAELQCKHLHTEKVYYEDIVISEKGGLQNTFVYIKGSMKGNFEPPTEPVVIDQVGCVFIPHVAGAVIGQPVEFLNSDQVLHNVRTVSTKEKPLKEKPFNISQPREGMKYTHTFTKMDIGIPLRCDVHHWMSAFVHVLPHPFFAVTEEAGTFKIQGLPPRTYTLEAWHGKLGVQKIRVTVEAGKTQEVEFVFASE
ncbi:hypothetical protein J5I95_24635 [Candidatus Poribacteria bacterium]|nr:hypothetical protein [Candidatus Poribacteria bacterium]